ncbi:MAG: sugar phosphate isomerase/epimerase [Opitutaceae bacterium]|nr:sugar phosphate isomerase/epimerase [Verrucomicrobiales bacterium]
MKLRLGGNVFVESNDPEVLAQAHVDAGFNAAYAGIIPLEDTARIRATREAFARRDILFAEVGAWVNLVTPDSVLARKNFDHTCRCLALADELGAPVCVTFLGSREPGTAFSPHPENLEPEVFDLAVEIVRKIVDEVQPRNARFGLEMMQWNLPDSVDCYAALLKAVERKAFAVHVDPVNFVMTPRQYYHTGDLIREIFRVLGPDIVACHAKDLVIRDRLALHFDEVRPGLGILDYRVYLQEIARLGREVPLMMEHLTTAEEYRLSRDFILSQQ